MPQIKIAGMSDPSRIQQLKKFLEENPDDPFLHYGIALELQKSEPEKAMEKFEEILVKFPGYLPVYYHAAHLCWEAGRLERAGEIFRQGIELAAAMQEQKTLSELENAYQNFQFDL